MLQNIPSRLSRNYLLQAIDELGFGDTFGFFYLPMKPSKHARNLTNRSDALVDFESPRQAASFAAAIGGYSFINRSSLTVITVLPARLKDLKEIRNHFDHTKVERTKWGPILRSRKAL